MGGFTRYKVSHVYYVIRKKLKAEAKRLCDSLRAEIGSSYLHTLSLGTPCCDTDAYLGAVPITWLLPFLQLGELDALFFNRAVSRYLLSLLRLCASSSLHFTHPHMRTLLSDAQTQLNMYSAAVAQFEEYFLFFCYTAPIEFQESLRTFRIRQLGMTVACDILARCLRMLPGWCVRLDALGELQLVQ